MAMNNAFLTQNLCSSIDLLMFDLLFKTAVYFLAEQEGGRVPTRVGERPGGRHQFSGVSSWPGHVLWTQVRVVLYYFL
jgi:hypothetical protein